MTLLRSPRLRLFLASFVALYFEVLIIRYLASEIRVFAYLKNVPLVASFFGIGLGMIFGKCPERLRRWFPAIFAALFLSVLFADYLRLDQVGLPSSAEYMIFGSHNLPLPSAVQLGIFILVVAISLVLITALFVALGGFIGEELQKVSTLTGYGINLGGSLAGLCAFSLLSFWQTPPSIWLLLGLALLVPFFWDAKRSLVIMSAVVVIQFLPIASALWSPYYGLRLYHEPILPGWDKPSAIYLTVNHSYHQKIVDLSPEFLARFPDVEPNRSAVLNYELPYRVVKHASEVLIVGAGTGNDVAAALRHGATHIDAVEIDPLIYELGKSLHPEKPYDSPRVTMHINDARAFFKNAPKRKYDLILFAYLDAHTLLSSFSSIRLDNYVYTLNSFQQAKELLTPDGTLAVAFDTGRSFVDEKMFATLQQAFGVAPHAYVTQYDAGGILYVEGEARRAPPVAGVTEIGASFHDSAVLVPTDQWPFLYLRTRTVPTGILIAFVILFIIVNRTLRQTISLRALKTNENLQFFLLGAGFLLLETKSVTEMSLLFGSTWLTNVVVIGSFLVMAILANVVVALTNVSLRWAYVGLFASLLIGTLVPFSALDGLPFASKVVAAGIVAGLPVFFSGVVFSTTFRVAADPAQALGINLFGAVLGGALENLVMVGGTIVLLLLALALYAAAALALATGSRFRSIAVATR